MKVDVEFHATSLPALEEKRIGADFGVRLHLSGAGFNISKAVLFQNKRSYTRGSEFDFRQLRGDGERQANDMLGVTPASFFLLFNGIPTVRALNWIRWPSAWWPLAHYGPFPHFPSRMSDAMATSPELALWNPGVLVLPATRVYAESRALKAEGKKLPVGARHWAQASIPLGVFMADMLGSCFVGDVREDVIRLVTPPSLRGLGTVGVPVFDSTRLPVRRLMDVAVTVSEEGAPS